MNFSKIFAKRRKQIWDSPLTVQFFPNGPTLKALVVKTEYTGKPPADEQLKYGILTATDCSLEQYTIVKCSEGRKFKITSIQTIKEECFNIVGVDLL